MTKVLFAVAAALMLAFLPAAHGANGGTIVVDNDFADCPNADTASIQPPASRRPDSSTSRCW